MDKPNDSIVRGLWMSYLRAVGDDGAIDFPPVQVQEMRRSFYAGAHALLTEVVAGLSPGDEVEEADTDRLYAIEQELAAFKRAVESGRA